MSYYYQNPRAFVNKSQQFYGQFLLLFCLNMQDVAVEAFSGSNQKMMLFSYFNVFFAAGLLVTLHVLFVDRTFSEVLGRLI